jgi:hypothetical protein
VLSSLVDVFQGETIASVPLLDYSDDINDPTWDIAMWMKADVPDSPKEST